MKHKNLILILLISLLALSCRLLYLHQFSSLPLFDHPSGPDISEYDNWARTIISGQLWWTTPQIHAPLYPIFLALLYKLFNLDYYLIRLGQNLLAFAALLPLFFVLKNRLKQPGIAWVYLILGATYPPLLYYQSELISEALLLPLLSLALASLYWADDYSSDQMPHQLRRNLAYIIPGTAIGLAVITHPLTILFLLATVITITINRFHQATAIRQHKNWQQLLPGGILLFSALTIILPIMIYNSSLPGGSFVIQHNSGVNFYIGNNSQATGGCYIRPGKDWDELLRNGNQAARQHNCTIDRYYFKQVGNYITRHPGAWLKLLCQKALYVWNYRLMISGTDLEPLRYYTPLQRWSWWSNTLLLPLALLGTIIAIANRENRTKYRYLLVLLVSYWLGLTVTVVSSRYRLAMLPALFVMAPLGGYAIYNFFRQQHCWQYRIKSVAIFIITLAVVFLPHPYSNWAKEQAEADILLGETYLKIAKTASAESCFKRAIRRYPDADTAYTHLGTMAMKRGQYQQAAALFIKSVSLNSASCEAYVNLGVLSMVMGDLNNAGKYFAEAEKRWPHEPFMLYNYAVFLIKRHQLATAEKYLMQALKLQPYNPKTMRACGAIYLIRNQPAKALPYFKRILKIAPWDHDALLFSAAVSLRTKHYEEAKHYIDLLLKYHPDSRKGRELRKVISKYQ